MFLAYIIFLNPLLAQENNPNDIFSSPYQTIYTHLYHLQEEHFQPERSALTVSFRNRSPEEAKELALKLKQINGEGVYIDMDLVPRNTDYLDSLSQQHKYLLSARYPNICLVQKENGRWMYSEETAEKIDALY